MTFRIRDGLVVAAGLLLALFVGIGIAQEDWFWPGLAIGTALGLLGARLSPWPPIPSALAVLITGYIVGNRGFAQLSVSGSLPLFPAELGLALSLVVAFWHAARHGNIGIRFDAGNTLVALWIAYGTARLLPDLSIHGVNAVRDYATVYYALFFFIAQLAAQQTDLPSLLSRCIRWGTAALLPLYALFETFPEFFLDTLTFRGVPVLYYKGDLAGTFLALGAIVWFFHYTAAPRRYHALLLTLVCVGGVLATHNRASLLGLAVVVALLALSGRTGFLRALLLAGAAGALALTLWVQAGLGRWADTPVPAVMEGLASITDVEGRSAYQTESAEPKGDNNRFRAVWWRAVIAETSEDSPLIGLGFGHDLADRFLRAYYPDSNDVFTARSPHSILVTVFARLGWIGLAGFCGIVGVLLNDTWRLLRRKSTDGAALPGCVSLGILISACFGVVLEGPMGAVIFWISLGLGHHLQSLDVIPVTNAQPSLDTSAHNV